MNNSSEKVVITGPFSMLLTMDHLPLKGRLSDGQLEVLAGGGIVHQGGTILETGIFKELVAKYCQAGSVVQRVDEEAVALPGFIDAHTHLVWAGSRETDYAMRLEGKSYLEIAREGGGIWSTVQKTRQATDEELINGLLSRLDQQLNNGITTCEVKSGYALDTDGEIRLLEIIRSATSNCIPDLVPTCLAAHVRPADFPGTHAEYMQMLASQLLPVIRERKLTSRVDIFVEEGAFGPAEAARYLESAKSMGFDLTVHADQFSPGGTELAIRMGAASADHLEVIPDQSLARLASSGTVAVALPGSSLGLGAPFAPARKLLDAGCCLAIASDWNPGSAPMGDLLAQASILGTFEKLTMAEQLSAITVRAARALRLPDRGVLKAGCLADFVAFPVKNYREILYRQGALKPFLVWKNGEKFSLPRRK